MERGLIHIYTGEGKGKTTAAVGLAARAAGHGLKVLFVQFFKPDGDSSGEKEILKNIEKIELIRPNIRHPIFTKNKKDPAEIKKLIKETFQLIEERIKEGKDLLVLDEIIGALNGGFIGMDDVLGFLDSRPRGLEVVMTGRDAPPELVRRADYVTEMLKIKHPYDEGIKARKGVEF